MKKLITMTMCCVLLLTAIPTKTFATTIDETTDTIPQNTESVNQENLNESVSTETTETNQTESQIEDSSAQEDTDPPPQETIETVPNTSDSQTVETTETSSETETNEADIEAMSLLDPTTQFVNRLYQIILNREPDEEGLNTWVTALQNRSKTGSDVIEGFVLSDEFTLQNKNNEEFVEIMYNALLGRASDPDGKNTWVNNLEAGFTRSYVCAGFNGSTEFHKMCESYGIDAGSFRLYSNVDKYPLITKFVSRIYNRVLSRKPDVQGLENWVTQLSNHQITGAQAVSGFIFSEEYLNKNVSDSDYINTLYQVILDRAPDSTGQQNWQNLLNKGVSRGYLFWGFIGSTEFWKLCDSYGIETGTVLLSEARDLNIPITDFVTTTYSNLLGRKPSVDDLNTRVQRLAEKPTTARDFISDILFSAEMGLSQQSNEVFINKAYIAALQRQPRNDEINYWLNHLSSTSRQNAFNEIASGDEFSQVLAPFGLYAVPIAYQNPSQFLQIQDSIAPLSGGDYELGLNYMGLKVYKVQKRLGISNHRAIVDMTFMNEVRKFQKANGLKVDGIVGLNTWRALGFSDYDWYNIGTYISPMLITKNRTRDDCINAMITTAKSYLGTEYIIGASGAPGTGADCSGLVMQALYAAGIDMSPINPVRHSHPGYEYESRNMFNLSTLKHVSTSERQKGDLIFYQNSAGVIIHVAIYLGSDQVIEAWPDKVVIWPIQNAQRSIIAGVRRPFV